jgi:hypothetical protein
MTPLPLVSPFARTAAERAARAAALRVALGPAAGWPEEARAELEERVAIAEVDGGVAPVEAAGLAEDAVRAGLLRRIP